MRSDDELYSSFASGDDQAYDELMIRYGDALTVYLNGYLHHWQDSEDLMIEAFARIMVKRPSIREGNFKAYLFKTARNLATRFHSKSTRIQEFSIDEISEDIHAPCLTEDLFQGKVRLESLYRCLGRIDPIQREALWLVYYDGMSYEEAANIMKVNKKKIDHLLSTGKKQMRSELAKEGIINAFE